jgi:hypothetical protein
VAGSEQHNARPAGIRQRVAAGGALAAAIPPRPEALSLQAAGQSPALSMADGVVAIISVISAATVKIHGNRQQIRRLGPGMSAATANCSPSASHDRTCPEPDVPCRALG